jgi:hypothetical protein
VIALRMYAAYTACWVIVVLYLFALDYIDHRK